MNELTVIIPTRNRRAIVHEALARLGASGRDLDFEVIVVDDGSDDGTPESLEREAGGHPFELTVMRQSGLGPATARNRALAAASAPVCLFIDDDTWPRDPLLPRHAEFHRRRPEPTAALLGFVDVAPAPEPSPFMTWLSTQHLGFGHIEDPEDAGGRHFFTGNVSAKTELLRSVGGFDESYPDAGHEDIDLGLRLEERGMRLAYDPEAAVEHYHPTDLPGTVRRMRAGGWSLARRAGRHESEVPRRPDLRHRIKAAALTVPALMGVRTPRVQQETWRFLCHESKREGYWDAVHLSEGRRSPSKDDDLRIGAFLARLASRDPDAQMPPADTEFEKRGSADTAAAARA